MGFNRISSCTMIILGIGMHEGVKKSSLDLIGSRPPILIVLGIGVHGDSDEVTSVTSLNKQIPPGAWGALPSPPPRCTTMFIGLALKISLYTLCSSFDTKPKIWFFGSKPDLIGSPPILGDH